MNSETAKWPSFIPDDFQFKGYEVDEDNRPIFKYNFRDTQFKDQIVPRSDGKSLVRKIRKLGEGDNLYCRIAAGKNIQLQPNGLYNVDGAYYIEAENLILRDNQELLAKVNQEIMYILHW